MALLRLAARHGQLCLVAGLLAGLALPGLAQAMRPWLGEMVAFLLFLTAFRVGARAAWGGLADLRRSAWLVGVLQLALPLGAVLVFSALDWLATPLAVALVLMLAAPSISGAPNLAIMLGLPPAPAIRVLVLGTALVPLTALPVLGFLPGIGSLGEATLVSLRLVLVVLAAVGAGFVVRKLVLPDMQDEQREAVDGLAALMLAVVVIGLMSAIGPLARDAPGTLLIWLAAAMAVNLGLQVLAYGALRGTGAPDAAQVAIIAGNRNIALYLVALPDAVMDPLLIFIGCYQVPMYLTPLLMRRLYRS